MNYIIFKMSIPQNPTKHLPFQSTTNSLIPATPSSQTAAKCPNSAKSEEQAKQNMAEMSMRRNSPRVPSGNTKQVDTACPNETMLMKGQRGDMAMAQAVLEVRPKHRPI